MQNIEQIRLILDWERDNWRLGNVYKNNLAELKKSMEDVSFEVVPRGGKLIGGDKIVTFRGGRK